jgi:CRISPR-associated protein Cas2
MHIVFSYDIPDNKRRERLRKTLLRFGNRVQFSVFECDLTPRQLEQLKKAVMAVIEKSEDNVRYYLICGNCAKSVEVFGGQPLTEAKEVYVV